MQKVGHETVRRSIKQFKRTTYNEDLVIKTNIRITWISQMQICFKPEIDEKNFYPIKDPVNHCSLHYLLTLFEFILIYIFFKI